MVQSNQFDTLALECAKTIRNAFRDYNHEFRQITQRAKGRFEQRDWQGSQRDAVERIELYSLFKDRTVVELKRRLGFLSRNKQLWRETKQCYETLIQVYLDVEFTKTFFNSITREFFNTVGVDADLEFLHLSKPILADSPQAIKSRYYQYQQKGLEKLFEKLLDDFAFSIPFKDKQADSHFIVQEISKNISPQGVSKIEQVEILDAIFYQIKRAYLVCNLYFNRTSYPLIIALKNNDFGIEVNAVMMSVKEVSILFSYTRSYFQVDLETVSDAVVYLKSILPQKTVGELYTVLGRAKQGKTDRYRTLLQHLENTDDLFVHAPGEKGLVMVVFTMPTHEIVIKVIRDKFSPPKTISRKDVLARYKQVFEHDRAGRLADAQEFQYLKFKHNRFDADFLEELKSQASEAIILEGEDIIFKHCYIEHRLIPLNIYLQNASREDAERIIYDYGQAIRDLALSNIFPGDLLLKNFGVTSHGRVIFYDYDELCMVTDCHFRDLPTARTDAEEMHSDAWFYVADNDIFPEQFISFLGFDEHLQKVFLKWHGEILTSAYWRQLQNRHRVGEVLDVVPYHHCPF